MQRYFVKSEQINPPFIFINNEDAFHIGTVMRMKLDDKVYVCDEVNTYIAKIVEISKTQVKLEIIEIYFESKELPVEVTIAQGLVRREKMEEVIDYITELGASKYLPVNMERSIIKINAEQFSKKKERLNHIAKEASEQSHRSKKLIVEELISFNSLLELRNSYDLCLYAYEASSSDDSFKKILREQKAKKILVLVGPEGGISDKEVELLKNNNFLPISLGPRILRTQVAPLYVMAAISYELEAKE